MIIGRRSEQDALLDLVDRARRGAGGTLILRGDAGIGKTALLEHLAAQAGITTLPACGYEGETGLPFAVLHDLLHPVLDQLDALPATQRDVIRAALGLAAATVVDPVAVEVATARLLEHVATQSPVLVIVDDMHWLDPGSLSALMYIARRASRLPLAVVGAARPDEMNSAIAALPSLTVHPMELGDAAAVLRSSSPEHAAPWVRDAVLREARGNPLAIRELVLGLSPAQLAGHAPITEPMSVSTGVVLDYRHRIDEMPASTRQALLLAAAEGRGRLGPIGEALRLLESSLSALEPAERLGLIHLGGERVEFRHPLISSVVYQGATPAERRIAHGLLASVDDDLDRRARHLGRSVVGPDRAACDALIGLSNRALARGADGTAAHALTRAAELLDDDSQRGGLLLKAARAANRAGNLALAAELAAQAEPAIGDDAISRADLTLLDADLRMRRGDYLGAQLELTAGAESIADVDSRLAIKMLLIASKVHVNKMEATLALRVVDAAERLAVSDAPDTLRATSLAMAQTMAGHPDAASTAREAARASRSYRRGYLHAEAIGWPLVWLEHYELATRFLAWAGHEQRSGGYHSFLPQTLLPQAELDFRLGHWEQAVAAAEEAHQLFVETGQLVGAALAEAMLARIAAAKGDHRAEAAAEAAIAAERTSGLLVATAFAESALGHLALSERRYGEAIDHLERTVDIMRTGGVGEPWLLPADGDLAEALIHAGRVDDAVRVIECLEHLAIGCTRLPALAAVARCRGLMAPDDAFADFFELALTHHSGSPTPFERARTELCFGERLRRVRLRTDARRHLHAALDVFEAVGARTWADRTVTELQASGEARRQPAADLGQLTAQERQVARRVANGATNKEVAQELYVSTKTVEYHLRNVYRKLGIRSRAHLARHYSD